jgi:hypothetical protein
LINHTFGIGLADYDLSYVAKTNVVIPESDDYARLDFNFNGVELEYIVNPHKAVNFSVKTLVGSAKLVLQHPRREEYLLKDRCLVIEPGMRLNLNVFRYFRVSGGVSYRIAQDVELAPYNISDTEISGINAVLELKFGWF